MLLCCLSGKGKLINAWWSWNVTESVWRQGRYYPPAQKEKPWDFLARVILTNAEITELREQKEENAKYM